MRLTQSLCVNPDGTNNMNCCQTSPILNKATGVITQSLVCSHWSGAHISSQGCIQFGVLETEAAFNMPAAAGGIAFFGTYMFGAPPPPPLSAYSRWRLRPLR